MHVIPVKTDRAAPPLTTTTQLSQLTLPRPLTPAVVFLGILVYFVYQPRVLVHSGLCFDIQTFRLNLIGMNVISSSSFEV